MNRCIHADDLKTQKINALHQLGCVWFDINRIPSVKQMQRKMNFYKEIKIWAFGSAMENSPVRTRFDLNPKQEWIQAHVAQTMNL